MTPVLAHLGHWYHALLYLAPVVVVGLGLWWAGRGEDEDDDEVDDDAGLDPARPGVAHDA